MVTVGKVKAWKDYLKKNVILSPAWDRQQRVADVPTPFCLTLKTVEGLMPQMNQAKTEFQLRMTLFDVTYKQFFGRTWVGPVLDGKNTPAQKTRLNYNQNVYFHTSINDLNIVAVVEIIAVSHVVQGNAQQVACGWGMFRLFKYEGDMPDTSSSAPAPAQRMDIYHGSPRALMFMEDPIESNEHLSLVTGCQLIYTICTHRNLQRVMHLLPENVLVGSRDIVPGILEASKDLKDPQAGADNLKKPKIIRPLNAFLDRVNVTLYPNVEKFEEELCRLLNEDRINRDNKVADGTAISVVERRIKVGVHNGWCYVAEPEVMHLVPDSENGKKSASLRRGHQRSPSINSLGSNVQSLVLKNRVQLDSMVEDGMFTIVMVLEYVVSEPVSAEDRKLSHSMVRSQTSTVCVRWAAWSPLTSDPEVTLQLMGGPTLTPDMTFIYKLPASDVQDDLAAKLAAGTVSFNYSNQKKVRDPLGTHAMASLTMPSQENVRSPSAPSLFSETSSVLQEMPTAGVMGRPPLPHKSPYKAPPAVPPRALPQTHHQVAGYDSSPRHQVARYDSSPRHQVAGYDSSSRRQMAGYDSSPRHQRSGFDSSPGHQVAGFDTSQRSARALNTSRSLSSQYQPDRPEAAGMPPGAPHPHPGAPHPGMMYSQSQAFAQSMYGGGYGSMVPPMPYSMQMAPPGLYPMEITHIRDQAASMMGMADPELNELPFTPIHAPIMALPPNLTSGQGLSRAAYAKLYSAGFPPILDRHHESADVADPADHMTFVASKEEADHLQTNEIVMQFLAFSRMLEFDAGGEPKKHSTVFFTFQFYRFPEVTTERLFLGNVEGELSSDPKSLPCVLQKLAPDGSVLKGPPGYQLKYHVDPTFLKPGEGRLFVEHLSKQTLHIDVWDGDSLLLIGSCSVDLKHLLRQGREAVQVTYELDVVTTEYSEDTIAEPTKGDTVNPVGVQAILKGRLHIRLGNIGYPIDPKKLSSPNTMPSPIKPTLVVADTLSNSFLGGSLNAGLSKSSPAGLRKTKMYRAKHLAETNQELASLLFTRKESVAPLEESNREADSEKKRKLARMQAVRAQQGIENVPQSLLTYKQEKQDRARDLKTIESYRSQTKRDGILSMLNTAITTEHIIHPAMGTTEFFEFVLKNPYNIQHTVTIECQDENISVVTDAREWKHFKMLNEIYTPVEEGMFNTKSSSKKPQIFLRPKESVNVPLKLLSFSADHSVMPQGPLDPRRQSFRPYPDNKHDAMESRVVKVYFMTEENKPISILSVRIEPQPHIIDSTFRFHHPEQSFLKKSIRLPPLHRLPGVPVGGSTMSQLFVRCSDPHVICESRMVQQGEPHDIFLKVACGASPQVKKFYICIYTDLFLSKPVLVWQFYIHALQRVDVSCVEGQTSRFTLILRGTQASRLVRCYSSHPAELQMHPTENFMLAANAVHEIHVGVRPRTIGSKFMYINVVDTEYHQLVRTWLVCVQCRPPLISKAFQLDLPVGGGRGSNKKISYTNPYPAKKAYHLRTNREDLLQFKETRLDIAAGESQTIGLRFAPSQAPGLTEILIFINDEDDKNEETFCVKANYM